MRTIRATASVTLSCLALTACGSQVPHPDAAPSPSSAAPVASASQRPSGRPAPSHGPPTASPTPSARATGLGGDVEPRESTAPLGGWCALRPAWDCIDAATMRRWWPGSQRPEPPPGVPHSYVVYGRRGARVDLPPSADRGSTVALVLHPAGVTPREHGPDVIVRKGAIVVKVLMRDRYEDGPVPPSAKKVTVRGRVAYLMRGPSGDDDYPLRMVVWTEKRGSIWFVWTSLDGQPYRSDEELVGTLNSLGRS